MPVFSKQFYSDIVPENIELHTPLSVAIQAESPLGRKLIYTIVKGNELEEFSVDFNTGMISNSISFFSLLFFFFFFFVHLLFLIDPLNPTPHLFKYIYVRSIERVAYSLDSVVHWIWKPSIFVVNSIWFTFSTLVPFWYICLCWGISGWNRVAMARWKGKSVFSYIYIYFLFPFHW